LLLLVDGTFTSVFKDKKSSVFKDKKSLRRHKTVEIKVFFTFLLNDGRIRICTNYDVSGSTTPVVDRHRFDEDPDSDRHQNSASAHADPTPILHTLENQKKTFF
jgi:hypothetical protein